MKSKLFLSAVLLSAVATSAQVSTINENFSTFTTGPNSIPQKGWNKVTVGGSLVSIEQQSGANYLYLDTFNNDNTQSYGISPQVVPSTGSGTLSFRVIGTQGNPPGVTVDLGLVASPTDMTSFQVIGTVANPSSTTAGNHLMVMVPATTKQYFAVRFSSPSKFASVSVTDVVYNANASTLGVADYSRTTKDIQFVVNSKNTALEFVTKADPKKIQIYSAGGQKVAEGKLKDKSFDITQLQTGVYYITIEDNNGSVTKSKFTKK